MAIRSSKIIHSDEKRHKCHFCGAVRYESKMFKLKRWETHAVNQFGNSEKCWACLGECLSPENVRTFR